MIKRGNLAFALIIFGILPLLGAIVASYWLVARTSAQIQARAEQVITEKTRQQLQEVCKAHKATIENHLQQVDYRLASFAREAVVISASTESLHPEKFVSTTLHPETDAEMPDGFKMAVTRQIDQLRLSNVMLCDVVDGRIIYSYRDLSDADTVTANRSKLNRLFHAYLASDLETSPIIGLPFDRMAYESYDQVTYVAAPVMSKGQPIALAIFEVSLNKLGSLIGQALQTHDCQLLVNNAENIAVSIDKNKLSAIESTASEHWNLAVVATADQSQTLEEIASVTRKSSALTLVMFGAAQAGTLWTVLLVIAFGSLFVNHLKKPLENATKVLKEISLEGTGLMLDGSTNQKRSALLKFLETTVDRVDGLIVGISGQRSPEADLTALAVAHAKNARLATAEAAPEIQTGKRDDSSMREIIRRSQQSLASAVEAARLAEQAISKLGTDISPKEIHDLHEVVTNINEQSKWLYENSSWLEEPTSVGT